MSLLRRSVIFVRGTVNSPGKRVCVCLTLCTNGVGNTRVQKDDRDKQIKSNGKR